MPNEFHHPYNFIPATAKVNGRPSPQIEWRPGEQYDPGNTGARHDLWLPGTVSGRIICRVHLDTPTVVGAEQIKEDGFESKRVLAYQRNEQPAIPGSSLRGMIGSIAETLSQSSLRVLEDRMLSVRKPVNQGLSAIGMLKTSNSPDERTFDLLPLTMPTLQVQHGQYQLNETWRRVFCGAPLAQCLAAYVDGYIEAGTRNQPRRDYQARSFLATQKPDAFNAKTPVFYYARLVGVPSQDAVDPIPVGSAGIRETNDGMFLLGQRIDQVISQAEYDRLTTVEQNRYTKGILRVLGIKGRQTEIPKTKKHEVFIPTANKARLPVPDEIVNQFVLLANQRYEDSKERLPFALQGYTDWYPESGQLFFFDIELDEHKNPYVSEISISSIWRKPVDATSWNFFQSINRDLAPLNPGRTTLTPAELLLGVVEERQARDEGSAEEEDGNTPKEPAARALASRVRFHDALPIPGTTVGVIERPVTLKILSSPKLPCPAMYFHPRQGRQGQFVAKTELAKEPHLPNGRKVYLHHPKNPINPTPWESSSPNDHADQKVRCTPLNADQNFYFHIDFENLSKAELTLLLMSLRPSLEFRHRLGLGKSLGLGSVRVNIEGLFLVDRHRRCGNQTLTALRYHSVWQPQANANPPWLLLYKEEAARLNDLHADPPKCGPLAQQAAIYDPAYIDGVTLRLLATVGDPGKLKSNTPVQPPLLDAQNARLESETFKWFVENEKQGNRQALKPVQAGTVLPTLTTYPKR